MIMFILIISCLSAAAETPVSQPPEAFTASPFSGLIFIILVLLLISAAAAFQEFWLKGRLELIPLITSAPCDGTSTIPLKVQFVDPSGKPRKQLKDRNVEIRSTSGNVMKVVILKGEETAETELKSSNVCGIVTLEAKSGIQKANARVNFAGNVAGLVLEVAPSKIPADGISISSVTIKIKDDKGNFITSPDERIVEMSTSLGTVTSPVKIPPGTLSGIAILSSCMRTGTATITATFGSLHGEKKVVFEELAERYCMNCGDPMKREMTACPTCKKTPPPDTEIKECYSCSGVIPATAMFCDKCGAKQPV
ncbi:Double zinc ribbon [uncultured archaeon]|nr:Double zinc ribbon [uncultured archaeon]